MQAQFSRAGAFGLLLCVLGCAGVSQIQPVATQFDQGAHSVVTSEENLFQALRTTDCNSQFYAAAVSYALGKGVLPPVNGDCTPTQLTDAELAIRKGVLDAISLYADKVLAVSGGTNTALDTNAKTLAGALNAKFSKADKGVAAGVEAAIIELANIALDEQRLTDIQTAASAAAPELATVIAELKKENADYSAAIDGNIGGVEVGLNDILRHEQGPHAFFDAAAARTIMAAQPVNHTMAEKLNAALDALVTANAALANPARGGIVASVNELVARAKDAETLYSALNK
jgi:hypothetical protein